MFIDFARRGTTVVGPGGEHLEVLRPCGGPGHLRCLAHEVRLWPPGHVPPGRESMDVHTSRGLHKLVWWCQTHGPECANPVEYRKEGR